MPAMRPLLRPRRNRAILGGFHTVPAVKPLLRPRRKPGYPRRFPHSALALPISASLHLTLQTNLLTQDCYLAKPNGHICHNPRTSHEPDSNRVKNRTSVPRRIRTRGIRAIRQLPTMTARRSQQRPTLGPARSQKAP